MNRLITIIGLILIMTIDLSGQNTPTSLIKDDSIKTRQGWVRQWDGITLIADQDGKVMENVFSRKGSKLARVKLPKGEWICDLKKFVRNKDGQDFMLVYAHEWRRDLYVLVKGDTESFRIDRKRRLMEVDARMKLIDWGDSIYIDERRLFLRRWDNVIYFNQEFDEYSAHWLTKQPRSPKLYETGVFERGIATENFRFYINENDSVFYIGFGQEDTGKFFYYPVDSLVDYRVSIRKNERPFWSYRFDEWEKIEEDSLSFGGKLFVKDQQIELNYPEKQFEHIFRMRIKRGNAYPMKVSRDELTDDFVPDSFRINRFYDVLMNGKYVKLIEILGTRKVNLGGDDPVVGYLICEEGFEKDVSVKSD